MDDTGLKLIKQLQVSADLSLAELSRRVGTVSYTHLRAHET